MSSLPSGACRHRSEEKKKIFPLLLVFSLLQVFAVFYHPSVFTEHLQGFGCGDWVESQSTDVGDLFCIHGVSKHYSAKVCLFFKASGFSFPSSGQEGISYSLLFKSLIRRSSRWTMMHSLLTARKWEPSGPASHPLKWFSPCVPALRARNQRRATAESKKTPAAMFCPPCCGRVPPTAR